MAIYAAENYGCKVTTTTISREQLEHARAEVEKRGLQDKITLLFEDYRDLSGQFDKLVSIEMIEAVGHEYFDTYFNCVSNLLKPDGKAVIQAITINKQRYDDYRKSVDFIKRYIFPGGCLPSLNVISGALTRRTDMQIIDLRDIASITREHSSIGMTPLWQNWMLSKPWGSMRNSFACGAFT